MVWDPACYLYMRVRLKRYLKLLKKISLKRSVAYQSEGYFVADEFYHNEDLLARRILLRVESYVAEERVVRAFDQQEGFVFR